MPIDFCLADVERVGIKAIELQVSNDGMHSV